MHVQCVVETDGVSRVGKEARGFSEGERLTDTTMGRGGGGCGRGHRGLFHS